MKLLKKILPVLCICLFIFATGACAKTLQLTIGDPYITIQDLKGIDTNKIDNEGTAPFVSNGRTLVPVRVIAESFGSKVGWDDATRTVTITSGKTLIKLVIGSNTATVNGKTLTLDVPANIYGERTFVPIRFVTESLGYNVSYVDMTKDVIITDLPAIMEINGNKVSMETYNLIKFLDEYSFEGKTSAELVEYSKNVYSRIETTYKKYNYVFSKGETLPADKQKAIKDKLFTAFEDEDTLNSVLYGVYVSWEEKLAYAEIYDEKYTPEKQDTSVDTATVEKAYNERYYAVDYLKIGEKSQENLTKIIDIEKAVAADGWDAVVAKYAEDASVAFVKGFVIGKEEAENILFDTTIDLDDGGISEAVILDDGYYIAKKGTLPAMSEDIKAVLSKDLEDSAVQELSDELKNIPCQIIVTSDSALDLAE